MKRKSNWLLAAWALKSNASSIFCLFILSFQKAFAHVKHLVWENIWRHLNCYIHIAMSQITNKIILALTVADTASRYFPTLDHSLCMFPYVTQYARLESILSLHKSSGIQYHVCVADVTITIASNWHSLHQHGLLLCLMLATWLLACIKALNFFHYGLKISIGIYIVLL